jgi:hypothetical protein
MPGGVAELIQASGVVLDSGLDWEDIPGALAEAVMSTPIVVEIKHEHAQTKNAQGVYVDAFNSDGSPKMRDVIHSFKPASDEFVGNIEKEAAGLDDDLPF